MTRALAADCRRSPRGLRLRALERCAGGDRWRCVDWQQRGDHWLRRASPWQRSPVVALRWPGWDDEEGQGGAKSETLSEQDQM